MKVENAELEAFVVAAELLNFQRAAEKLHLTQPGLSRRIQKLEQTLGVELFSRTTRSMVLTGAGRHFLPMARQQINNLNGMLDSIREVAERRFGKIRVASIPTVVCQAFPSLLRTFTERHPNVGVQVFDGNQDFVVRQVLSGLAEFGIGVDPGTDPDLTFAPLLADRFVLAVHKDDALAARREVTLQELQAMGKVRLVIGGRDSGNRLLLEVLLGNAGLKLRWFYEVEHVSCILGLLEAGVGCAILPAMALPTNPSSNIRTVPISAPEIKRTVGVIRHRSLSISPLASEFLDLVARNLGAEPASQ
ncbi:LysR family transcriptional regulator [Bradyrhizobium sp. PMVTL-01]|uniref:LysR family transcriptional regulator n=1 Tax=Bradyrhizobium sp. PMVTL-01 TaxID=3434999 RepID=UPI003F6FB26F